MKLKITSLAILGIMFAPPVFAASQTINLSVPGMFCASCPFIVQAAIGKVEGVQSILTSLETRTAVVVFDDEITTLGEIILSTTEVGYEAFLIDESNGS